MKFLPAQFAFLLHSKEQQRNIGFLLQFLLMLATVITLYSVLFHFIMEKEGQSHSWITGFYWTLTVMSTLGFGDITFTSDLGKIFSLIVLLSGIIFLLIMLPFTFIQFFYAPWLEAQTRSRAPRVLPQETLGHVIIVGTDPTAKHLARKLHQYGHSYAMLTATVQSALELQDQGYAVMVGDHDDVATFHNLRAENAAMIVALESDVFNTNVTFTVREACKETPIAAKVDQNSSLDILSLAGATHVFHFTQMLGQVLARRALGGAMHSRIVGRFGGLVVAETPVMRTNLEGKTLRECGLRTAANVNVVGVWTRGAFSLPNPDTEMTANMVLVAAGDEDQIAAFDRYAGGPVITDPMVVILGGGRVGQAAAEQLRDQGRRYRMVDKNPKVAKHDKNAVIGNAADLEVLEKAGVREATSIFITTHDDDLNAYLTIYCRRLRPEIQIISRATLDRNIGVLHSAGADLVISHASLVANTILNLLSPDKVLMLTEGLNIFRVPVPPQLAGKSLQESHIRARTGCSVVAVSGDHGLEITPDPSKPLHANTELILIGVTESERQFLDLFPKAFND